MSATENRHIDQQRATNRRKQVLSAAEFCFSRSGFHGTSMAEISKAAGMSAGHIYNYFNSKDDIIASFVEENMARVSAIMRDFEQQDDPLQAIFNGIEGHVREELDPFTWKLPLEIYAEASRNPKIAQLVQQGCQYSRTRFIEILKKGREKRGLAIDNALLNGRHDAIVAFFHGLRVSTLHHPAINEAAVVAAFRVALTPLLFE